MCASCTFHLPSKIRQDDSNSALLRFLLILNILTMVIRVKNMKNTINNKMKIKKWWIMFHQDFYFLKNDTNTGGSFRACAMSLLSKSGFSLKLFNNLTVV